VRYRAYQIISYLILDALQNERALDLRYRALDLGFDNGSLPNYKIMKQAALRARLGIFYPMALFIAPWVMLVFTPILWILAVFGALSRPLWTPRRSTFLMYPTTPQACSLIMAALENETIVRGVAIWPDNYLYMGRCLGIKRTLEAIFIDILVWIKIIFLKGPLRRDMILHRRDAFSLALISIYAMDSENIFITDDHYQRWSFLFSHLAQDFRIVQHGFFDAEINFPNPYGIVDLLYLRGRIFEEQFRRIFDVKKVQLFTVKVKFQEKGLSSKDVLLASSFPFIEKEIEFIRELHREADNISIAIKFHPAHIYDGRKEVLVSMADKVEDSHPNPNCRVFVSYRSFMELDYADNGIPTVSIHRAGSTQEAVRQIIKILDQPKIV